jgi:hypothetical protein
MKSVFRAQLYFIVCAALWIVAAPTVVFGQSNVVTEASEAALRDAMAEGGLVVCSFDQRGFARPVGQGFDLGAYELGGWFGSTSNAYDWAGRKQRVVEFSGQGRRDVCPSEF